MTRWGIGTNNYHFTSSIILEEAPWYIFAIEFCIQWICHFMPPIPLPKIKIKIDGEIEKLTSFKRDCDLIIRLRSVVMEERNGIHCYGGYFSRNAYPHRMVCVQAMQERSGRHKALGKSREKGKRKDVGEAMIPRDYRSVDQVIAECSDFLTIDEIEELIMRRGQKFQV